jgi:hypothetical protein
MFNYFFADLAASIHLFFEHGAPVAVLAKEEIDDHRFAGLCGLGPAVGKPAPLNPGTRIRTLLRADAGGQEHGGKQKEGENPGHDKNLPLIVFFVCYPFCGKYSKQSAPAPVFCRVKMTLQLHKYGAGGLKKIRHAA